MKIVQLQYFIESVKQNSITKAAKKLYVSQPAISKAIQDLEIEFNTSLFIRYNNQLALTDEGYHLYKLATDLVKNYEDVKEDMASYTKKTKSLKIGIPPMLGSFIISPLIKDYTIDHPDTELQIVELGSVANRKAIIDGDISLGLTILPENGQIEEDLEYNVIANTHLLFAVSKASVLSKQKTISFEELGAFPLILMKEDCLQSSLIQNKFKEIGIEPNVKIRTNQLYTIRELLINNNLGAFIFNQIIDNDDKIKGIPLKEDIVLKIVIAHKKNKVLSGPLKEFLDFVSNRLKEE